MPLRSNLFSVLLRDRRLRLICLTSFLGAVGGLVYGFASKPWFEASLTVVPGPKGGGALSAASMLAAELPIDLNLGGSDVDRILGVLRSRSVTDAVIRKFDLQARYQQRSIEFTRKILWNHCRTSIDKKPAIVTLTCEDTDPKVAQGIAAAFADAGNDVCHRIAQSSAAEERRFLEERLKQARTDVATASSRLRQFMEKNKLIDLPEQSKAVVSALATLKGEMLSKEIELSYLNTFSTPDESTSTQLRKQIGVMQQKLHSLEDDANSPESVLPSKPASRSTTKQRGEDIFPVAMEVPRLRFELQQLFRDEKVQETLFLLLTQRYELARINEARDTSAFQVLDDPVVPTEKSRPHRFICLLVGCMAGFMIGMFWVLRLKALAQSLRSRVSIADAA